MITDKLCETDLFCLKIAQSKLNEGNLSSKMAIEFKSLTYPFQFETWTKLYVHRVGVGCYYYPQD